MVQRNVYEEVVWGKKKKGRTIFTSIVTYFKINGYLMIIQDVKVQLVYFSPSCENTSAEQELNVPPNR